MAMDLIGWELYSFAAWNPVMPLSQLENLDILVPDSVPYKQARPLLEKHWAKIKSFREDIFPL